MTRHGIAFALLHVAALLLSPAAAETYQPNTVTYFAIDANDLSRARKFYVTVFGWEFVSWGTPDYFLIRIGRDRETKVIGGLRQRSSAQPISASSASIGAPTYFECTIAVSSIQLTRQRILEAGGKIVEEPHSIPGIGTLLYFLDTEGNRVGAMQYE